ncbi:response regulator transcription factor [Phototrophicus methaneseepsis]|uniref:Response regulator transcription factor n=1 Tax=Phototrophicus methaneseepsis TaxID=2710758 RepID=A0A7S8E982_9CHLR|nr:response regulator transcription factor [Phototrophicus methaneseepsis]QPC82702.1 response regulator transcription factor [Phototrophicus methaneseepsis]
MPVRRLLLIEDDFDIAELLLTYFAKPDYDVMHADTGQEGIDLARTRFPNLILLDVMLPDMDGYDVCRQLRQTALTKFIPTIFLTQRDERTAKVRGLQLGADDYVTKPFDIEELKLRIEGSIRRATTDSLYEQRTGLPTGQLASEEVKRHESRGADLLRLSLQNFQAYQDVYSFMAAQEVLYHTGKLIQQTLISLGTPNDFVGVVEDDFLVATYGDAQKLEQAIQEQFTAQVQAFYSYADAEAGGITAHAGQSNEQFVPLMSLQTIAATS